MAEYDSIAESYTNIRMKRPLYTYAVYPSFYNAIGNVRGKSILDLACGEGIVTRELKQRGAGKIVGIDASSKMIEIAQRQEVEDLLGIEYRTGTVGELGKIGDFDIVTGAFLLHYAKTRDELVHMCGDIAVNTLRGGIFFGLNNNPEHPLCAEKKYQNDIAADLPLHEGSELRVSYTVDNDHVAFSNYHWEKLTYESVLREAGFDLQWLPIKPTDEGAQKMGVDYWKEFLDSPFFVILKCIKS